MNSRARRALLILVLFLGLGLRLYHITYPYLDHHSWRQTDTAAIARNFYRDGFDILRPEVDWAGDGPRVVELELQVTPLLTAGLYAILGVQDWVGRVIPIAFWVAAFIYFYLLVRRLAGEEVALFSSLVLAILPLGVFFTRVLMPESGATFFSIAAIYHLSATAETGRTRDYSLAILFAALSFLSKLTNLFLLGPLLFIAAEGRRGRHLSTARMVGFFAATLALTIIFYAYMHATANIRLIPYRFGTDKWGNLTVWLTPLFYQVMFLRARTVIYTWLGLLLLVGGMFLPVRTRVIHVWLLSALAYVFLVATGNLVHSYYQMPLIAPGAFFVGLALARLFSTRAFRPVAALACASLLVLAIVNLLPMYGLYASPVYAAANKLREIAPSRSLVVYVPHRPDLNPELLYYADRKGWIMSPVEVSVASIEAFKRKGAQYLVLPVPRSLSSDLKAYLDSRRVWRGGNYLIFRL